MPRTEIHISAPDGDCPATLHVPDGGGPAPGVIFYPDAGGPRETLREMADELSAAGYVVLLPDVYYRSVGWAPFDVETVFSDPPERERLMTMARSVSADMTERDAGAFLDALVGRPEVAGTVAGVVGYCMGGRAALLVAGRHPDRVGAAASIHGGRLAPADDPDSPHLLADRVRAAVYVATAQNDDSFPPDQIERLDQAFSGRAAARYTREDYAAAHGFAVPDNPTYDPTAAERHRVAVSALFAAHLGT